MEPKPVQYQREPGYPTRREVLLGAASFALASFAGTGLVFAASKDGEIVVAPIFKHGEGRGADGCIVVTPPVFLSEEEGMQVLREELAKHGIKLKPGTVLKGVRIPRRRIESELVDDGKGNKKYQEKLVEFTESAKTLKLGGIDPNKNVAVKFLCEKNYYDLSGMGAMGSVCVYDFQETATYVAKQVKKQGQEHVIVGIFYDPLGKLTHLRDWKKEEKQQKEESKKQLRQQAQDFVAWLQKEMVIPPSKPENR